MLHEINMVARHQELVYPKKNKENEETAIIDPDKFPINRLSGDLVKEYESIWSTKKGRKMQQQIEKYFGHTLEVKDSDIDHHLAGKGVFLSCRN